MTTEAAQRTALQRAGFKPAETQVRHRLIVSIEGDEKTGKNNFAFTAPSPIAVISFDQGLEGVVEKFAAGTALVGGAKVPKKEIFVKEIKLPPLVTGGTRDNVSMGAPGFDYKKAWDSFVADFQALLDAQVSTIIWDTATEVYELQRLFRFDKLSEVPPNKWGPLKAEYRELIRRAYNSHTNLILLHKTQPEYVNDARTGRRVISGLTDIGFVVQVNLKTFRVDIEGGGSEFSIKVLDCRQNSKLNGEVLGGVMCSFPFLAASVFEDTVPGDWE